MAKYVSFRVTSLEQLCLVEQLVVNRQGQKSLYFCFEEVYFRSRHTSIGIVTYYIIYIYVCQELMVPVGLAHFLRALLTDTMSCSSEVALELIHRSSQTNVLQSQDLIRCVMLLELLRAATTS